MTISRLPELTIKPDALRWFNQILRQSQRTGHWSNKVSITPDRAAVLLSRNPDNRNLREAKVTQMVSDMQHGRFHFNGETIIVASSGLLNDGQHRLVAGIKSGKSFDTILVVGVERDTRYSIDTGSAKSAGDHLGVQGMPNAITAAAIARYVSAWKTHRDFVRRARVSAQEQIETVKNDVLLQEIAGWVDSQKYRLKDMLRGALSGFIFYIIAEKAPVEAKIFMDQLRLGAGLDSHSPIFLAREKLRHNNRSLTDTQRIEIVIRAWNHWCKSPITSISRLQIMDVIPEIATPNKRVHGDYSDTLLLTNVAPDGAFHAA